jgi:RNA polymerase sigma-70 factor, ECF subfamily
MSLIGPDEFVALYTRYERKLYRYVAAILTHPDDAEDVLQNTARVLWQKFDQYRPEEPFLPWACRIAHYEVLNHCQRERTRRRHFRPAVMDLLADARLRHDDLLDAQSHWLEECVRKLDESDRRLIERRYASERTLAELASESGRTPNALYKSLQRIRRLLLECVDDGLRLDGWK